MREFLQSGQVGNIELNESRKIRKEIADRWDSLGMTEGLKGVMKENIALLFENEAKYLLKEAVAADNSGSFETVVFPIIRRIFSKLLANDIVSVQAMNLPVGRLFFLLPQTSERDWNNTAEGAMFDNQTVGSHKGLMGYERTDRRNGAKYNRFYMPDEALVGVAEFHAISGKTYDVKLNAKTYDAAVAECAGNTALDAATIYQYAPEIAKPFAKSLYDLFYNDFLFDNSKGKVRIATCGGMQPVALKADGSLSGVVVADLKKDAAGLIRNIMVEVDGFASHNPGKLTGPDGNEMDSEAFLASLKFAVSADVAADTVSGTPGFEAFEPIDYRVVTQKYGRAIVDRTSPVDANGKMLVELDLARPCTVKGVSIDGYAGVTVAQAEQIIARLKAAWCQYDSLELETEIGEVSFKLDSVTVSVEERKLRATWSPELAQDVNAFHNIDAEAELTALLSEQIAAEIDREILKELRFAAPWQARWDVNGWRRMAAYSTNYTQKDWNQELITKINQISAQIHKATLRGGASFAVVSAEISALFNNLEYFHVSDASAESDQYNMGIERIGALGNRYQIFMDPYSPVNSIIMGHKGKSLLDTGYIYAPYIPMQLTPTIINPDNFAPVKGILTRYAKKCVNNRFYGAIRVDGLQQWDINELR